jgi:gas vesicle protein
MDMCEEVRANRKNCNGRVLCFLAGAAAGVAIGLLCAPRSGKAARAALSDAGRDWYGRSRACYQKGRLFMDDAADLFERGRRMASGGIE